MYELLFFSFAVAALGFTLTLILQRRPLYSVLSLFGLTISLAAIYVMLGAEFLAIVQLILGAGVALVFFLFALMLVNLAKEPLPRRSLPRQLCGPVIALSVGMLAVLIYLQVPEDAMVRFGDFPGQTASLGRRMFLQFLLPFQAVSILVLVALVGVARLAHRGGEYTQ